MSACTNDASNGFDNSNHSVDNICEQAQELVAKGSPREAIELIESVRTKYAGEKTSTAVPTTSASAAPAASPSTYCSQAYTNANYLIAERVNSESPLPNFPQAWTESKELWAVPPIGFGLSIVGGLIASAVLAAFLAKFRWFELKKINSKYVTWLGATGMLLLLTGTVFSSIILSNAAIGRTLSIDQWSLPLIIMMTTSIVLIALMLSNRIGLQITLRNSSGAVDQAKTSSLVVLIRNLGYQKNYNNLAVKMDNGANVLANSTVQGTPENRVIAILQFIITEVFGVSPWRAVIDETADGALVVIINRNGRSKANARISADFLQDYVQGLDLEGGSEGVARHYKMVAAVIIATLSQSYTNFKDLCGASDWRSIGLQYVSEGENDDERRAAVLRPAVEIDPGNLYAQLLLQIATWRSSTSGANINLFAIWLNDHSEKGLMSNRKPKPGYEQFYRMCLIHYLNAVRNLRNCVGFEDAHSGAHAVAGQLVSSVKQMQPKDPYYQTLLCLAEIVEIGVILNPELIQLKKLEESVRMNPVPVIRYNLACVLLDLGNPLGNSDLISKALGHLRHAMGDPELRKWSRSDPVLARVKLSGMYKKEFKAIIK